MASDSADRIVADQEQVVIPDLTIKDLLGAIPSHCFKRNGWRSSLYVVADFAALAAIYKTTTFLDGCIHPEVIQLPHPILYGAGKFALWSLYTFWSGLVATGLWVLAHECGHQAFSESKLVNNTVGWVLHSGLGVPFHSWRITHGKHHASTAHLTQDQVFVPKTRSFLRLPPFDPAHEDLQGASISKKVMNELCDALGDSPIGACLGAASYLVIGWPAYLMFNSSGQKRYPSGTNHFKPSSTMFSPNQWSQIIISDVGVVFWLVALYYSIGKFGFFEVFRTYLLPYLWYVESAPPNPGFRPIRTFPGLTTGSY
jgi:omega-6 fatty acid desaturase (delta-12 desaturase)